MGDRLYVGEAIAALHEGPLIVLQAVGGAQDGEMEPVGVMVLEHLPDTLLEVCGGYDLAKLARREAHLPDVAAGRLYGDVTDAQPPGVQPAPLQHQLTAPSLPIGRHREGSTDRPVHATAHRDDDAGAPQHLAHLVPQRARDLPRDLIQVESQPLRNRFGHSTSNYENR